MDQLSQILERLTIARNQSGLNQTQVARKLGMETAGAIAHWENGQRELTLSNFLRLCELYDISQEWALTGVNPNFDPQPLIEAFGGMTEQAERVIELVSSFRHDTGQTMTDYAVAMKRTIDLGATLRASEDKQT